MVIRTKLTEALGIMHPIVQGGMHYVGYASLAAAVSNAGGLGIITALTQPDPEALRAEIRKCRAMTDKPFGVNLTLLPVGKPPNYQGMADVIISEKIPVVETAGRNPKKWIKLFKRHNIYVIHKCIAVKHALTAQRIGADMISMDGFECGGHPGEKDIGNWVLLAQAARKLSIPFIASGGCATGRQLAAALSLGAEGMNCGTAFMSTKEAPIHDKIKQALVEGDENSTTLVMRTLKNTERVFNNITAQKVRAIEKEKPGQIGPIYPLVRGENYRKSFQETGDTESSVWSCGLSMFGIDKVLSCKDFIQGVVSEAETVIRHSMSRL